MYILVSDGYKIPLQGVEVIKKVTKTNYRPSKLEFECNANSPSNLMLECPQRSLSTEEAKDKQENNYIKGKIKKKKTTTTLNI